MYREICCIVIWRLKSAVLARTVQCSFTRDVVWCYLQFGPTSERSWLPFSLLLLSWNVSSDVGGSRMLTYPDCEFCLNSSGVIKIRSVLQWLVRVSGKSGMRSVVRMFSGNDFCLHLYANAMTKCLRTATKLCRMPLPVRYQSPMFRLWLTPTQRKDHHKLAYKKSCTEHRDNMRVGIPWVTLTRRTSTSYRLASLLPCQLELVSQ